MKNKNATAGLTIMLSIIVGLFIIGLIVMIFAIMGSQLSISNYDTTTASLTNESVTAVTTLGVNLAKAPLRDVLCTVSQCVNASNGVIIGTANRSVTNCNVASVGTAFNNTNWKCSYSYTYKADNTATNVINDTTSSVSTVTDWFPIFIVIGAMVVLILLTVIIITAIRSSGVIQTA